MAESKPVFNLRTEPYSKDVNFNKLANKDPNFKRLWKRKQHDGLDFQDPETSLVLAHALLRTDFGIELVLPDNRLCPPVPNRWNYVAWLQSLLDSTDPNYSGNYDPDQKVAGLDIGTGASSIYALLLMKTRPNYDMVVTDVDETSFSFAQTNITQNGLGSRTTLLQTQDSEPLIPFHKLEHITHLDFTICNPPFFASEQEMQSSLHGDTKSKNPSATCTGSVNEMVCPGGDFAFVSRLVQESLMWREQVTWYSSMLGKMSSLKSIIELLQSHDITNYAVGSINPGNKTKRWVVAWSFGDVRPRSHIARMGDAENQAEIDNKYLPLRTHFRISLKEDLDLEDVKKNVNTQLEALDLTWTWNPETSTGIGEATQNVWSRHYRRAQKLKMAAAANVEVDDADKNGDQATEVNTNTDDVENTNDNTAIPKKRVKLTQPVPSTTNTKPTNIALAFRIRISASPAKEVVLEWLRGSDYVIWESFREMVRRPYRSLGPGKGA